MKIRLQGGQRAVLYLQLNRIYWPQTKIKESIYCKYIGQECCEKNIYPFRCSALRADRQRRGRIYKADSDAGRLQRNSQNERIGLADGGIKFLREAVAGGKAKTVYSADYFRIVYSDIRFLMIFVYWTIQFNFMMYNIDYFKRDDSSSEVELLIEKECSVVPVEVKAKKGGTSSLDSLLKKDEIKYGYKIVNGNVE